MKPASGLTPQPTQVLNHFSESRKTRSGSSSAKDRAVKQSHKAAAKRDEVPRPKPFVFVGNLDINVTEKQLEELFSQCGKIHRVEIAQAGAWTIQPSKPTRYAYVEFETASAKTRALKMHGHMLQPNRRLIVCLHATGLPEHEKLAQSSIDLWDYEKAEKIKADARRFIREEPTIVLDNPEALLPSPKAERHKALSRSPTKKKN